MSHIVGIDLGTTNSLVAHVEGGIPRVIPDAEGRALLPSIVAWTPGGVVVGEAARRQLARNAARTVYSVKRLMGRGYEDVKDELARLPFPVIPQAEVVSIGIGDRAITPPEVSAHVLRALKQRAESHFGEPVEQAVITVPAYFNDAQRQATKDAGRIAGLEVLRIVNEPTAASLAYGLQKMAQGIIAVYDLGGGTFDISILRVKDGVFEVLATNGNTHLGGDDFDRAMVDWILADIRGRHHADLSGDAEALQEIRLGAEAAKCRLSFGIETLGGIVSVLIARNTTIPTLAKEYFTTSVDGQTTVDMHVLQGERELAKDNRSLARFDLAGIDPMPGGMPKIEVTFLIDANGILQVQAKELRTGKAASIEVKPTYGLTETQVEQMVEDSYTYAEDDVNARLLIETQTEADTVINHVERALRQAGGIATAEERARIEAALALPRTTRAGTDRDRIGDGTIELNQATQPPADRTMEASLKDTVTSMPA